MLKKTLSFFVAIMAITYVTAQEISTADDILDLYFENTGGEEAWKSLKSSKMIGKMNMQGMDFPGTIYAAPPNKQRVEVDVQGMKIIQAYDGEIPWWINPMQGGTEPQKMPEMFAEAMTKQKFESELLNYKDKGHSVELLEDKQEVEGTDCYAIKLTKESGDIETYYFDSEYFIPIMMKTSINSGPQAGAEVETYMSDYQEVEGGLMMPFYIETKMAGQTLQKITMESVEVNLDLEDNLFAFPKKDGNITAPTEKKEALDQNKMVEEKKDMKLPTADKKKKKINNNGNGNF